MRYLRKILKNWLILQTRNAPQKDPTPKTKQNRGRETDAKGKELFLSTSPHSLPEAPDTKAEPPHARETMYIYRLVVLSITPIVTFKCTISIGCRIYRPRQSYKEGIAFYGKQRSRNERMAKFVSIGIYIFIR